MVCKFITENPTQMNHLVVLDLDMDSIGFPMIPGTVSPLINFHVVDFQVWLPCPNLSYGKGLASFLR